jgi:hypothetical protein
MKLLLEKNLNLILDSQYRKAEEQLPHKSGAILGSRVLSGDAI